MIGREIRRRLHLLILGGTACLLSACLVNREGDGAPPSVVADGDFTPLKPAPPPGWPLIEWPAANPYTDAKAILGRRLFFDPVLSLGKERACAWCHAPAAAFADPRGTAFSLGVGQGVTKRNSPTLANMAFGQSFMLDGRAASLEEQALGPLFAENEMGMTEPEILRRLSRDTAYVRLFQAAFSGETVTLDRVVKALATYQRTLISHRSAYDRWRGGDSMALSAAAKRGAALFIGTKGGCARCHVAPLFTDGGFYNIGLDVATRDSGRGGVTGLPVDLGKFKTPTLRNVGASPPYMHDGRFRTLEEVLAHYNQGGENHPNRDPRIRPLGLSIDEVGDLVAFLRTLDDARFLMTSPFDPEN